MEKFAENLSKHFGLPWTGLIQQYQKANKEKPPDKEQCSRNSAANTTKLKREDAVVFGKWPALDECCFTMCGKCGAVIKPQALYSHIERRHNNINDQSTVEHLVLQKPVQKGLPMSKLKNKGSPRNSPKPSSLNTETNVLDKYQLPKPGSNKPLFNKVARPSIDKANSALAQHLSSNVPLTAQSTTTASDDLSKSAIDNSHASASPSSSSAWSESRDSLSSTPKSSTHALQKTISNSPNKKSSASKRSLDNRLSEASNSEPPLKKTTAHTSSEAPRRVKPITIRMPGGIKTAKLASSVSSPTLVSNNKTEPEMTVINTDEFKQPVQRQLVPTTIDKHIPCKDREYDPNRHCGCWLEEWGKHCTRSLTCKTHALSLRRKVPGRSKPFDQLLSEHREAKEAIEQAKARDKSLQMSNKVAKSVSKSQASVQSSKISNQRSSSNQMLSPVSEMETELSSCTDHTKFDSLGYSPFHPRPLSTSRYGARFSGSAYVPNRQLDFLRLALCCAIEQPKHTVRKSNVSKSKSLNYSQNLDLSGSFTSLTPAQKNQSSKKKKVKRLSIDSHTSNKGVSPAMSPATSSIGSPVLSSTVGSPINSSDIRLHQKMLSSSMNKPGTPGPSLVSVPQSSVSLNQASHAALLQSFNSNNNTAISNMTAGRINGPVETSNADNKLKAAKSATSFHMRTTGAGIGSLSNKAVRDGLPYTILHSNPTNSGGQEQISTTSMLVKSSDLLANGMVISSVDGQPIGEGQATLVELLPQRGVSNNPTAAFRFVKQDSSGFNGAENRARQANMSLDKMQHYTLSNGGTITTMQLKHQAKPVKSQNVSLTIPLVSQTSHHAQQQALHRNSQSAAAASAPASAQQSLS